MQSLLLFILVSASVSSWAQAQQAPDPTAPIVEIISEECKQEVRQKYADQKAVNETVLQVSRSYLKAHQNLSFSALIGPEKMTEYQGIQAKIAAKKSGLEKIKNKKAKIKLQNEIDALSLTLDPIISLGLAEAEKLLPKKACPENSRMTEDGSSCVNLVGKPVEPKVMTVLKPIVGGFELQTSVKFSGGAHLQVLSRWYRDDQSIPPQVTEMRYYISENTAVVDTTDRGAQQRAFELASQSCRESIMKVNAQKAAAAAAAAQAVSAASDKTVSAPAAEASGQTGGAQAQEGAGAK